MPFLIELSATEGKELKLIINEKVRLI